MKNDLNVRLNTPTDSTSRTLDVTDKEAIARYVSHLMQEAADLGIFNPTRPTKSDLGLRRKESTLRTEAADALCRLKAHIVQAAPADALDALEPYDLLHRIAYDSPADTVFTDPIVLNALDARIKGDQTVNEYTLYDAIGKRLEARAPRFMKRPLDWHLRQLDRWYREARAILDGAPIPPGLTPADLHRRRQILLRANLYAYEGTAAPTFKHRLSTDLL